MRSPNPIVENALSQTVSQILDVKVITAPYWMGGIEVNIKTYEIYQSPRGVELCYDNRPKNDGTLICKVRNYQAAYRISSTLAQSNQQQLTIIVPENNRTSRF